MISIIKTLMNNAPGGAGAGGTWPVSSERQDPRVIVQGQPTFCGCACALMIFQVLNVPDLPSQDQMFELGGAMVFSVETLSQAMNQVWESYPLEGRWVGQGIQPKIGSDYVMVIKILVGFGPWIAHLRDGTSKLGHFVVVAGELDNELEILDPAVPGTAYTMTHATFLQYWNYQAVYLRSQS